MSAPQAETATSDNHVEQDSALAGLQSASLQELLDAIDKLRTQELDLPQLIVCGNQSSGKSSVLEAISHVSFPSSQGTTTRFASEIVLRRAPERSISVSIRPGPNVTRDVAADLEQFSPKIETSDSFPEVLEQATQHMQTATGNASTFFNHLLRVEVSGPKLPHLTLVDLPGLIQSKTGPSAEHDIKLVEDLVKSYMSQPRSIILAVMSAQNDPETQPVFNLAHRVDPRGLRTLGILTKPDLVEPGSEDALIHLARNETDYDLELGWHVLKNRGHAARLATWEERDAGETEFFENVSSEWHKLPESSRGIDKLRVKLSEILFRTISQSLPVLIRELRQKRDACARHIRRLGDPRPEAWQQRHFLIDVSLQLNKLIAQAVDGHYDDVDFFDSERLPFVDFKRFRNRLKELQTTFTNSMALNGSKVHLILDGSERCGAHNRVVQTGDVSFNARMSTMCLSYSCALNATARYITRNRGRELDGDAPADAKAQIFKIMASPWEHLARDYIEQSVQATQRFLWLALEHVAPAHTATAIYDHVVSEALNDSIGKLEAKVSELVKPFQKFFPATRNPAYLTRRRLIIQTASEERARFESAAADAACNRDANSIAAGDILTTVRSYYEVAQWTFIDNVIALGTENCIVEPLKTVFTAERIATMDEAALSRIGSEPPNVLLERGRYTSRLSLLHEVLRVCNKYSSSVPSEPLLKDDESVPGLHRGVRANEDVHESLDEAPTTGHAPGEQDPEDDNTQRAAQEGWLPIRRSARRILQPRGFGSNSRRPATPPATPAPRAGTDAQRPSEMQSTAQQPASSKSSSGLSQPIASPTEQLPGFSSAGSTSHLDDFLASGPRKTQQRGSQFGSSSQPVNNVFGGGNGGSMPFGASMAIPQPGGLFGGSQFGSTATSASHSTEPQSSSLFGGNGPTPQTGAPTTTPGISESGAASPRPNQAPSSGGLLGGSSVPPRRPNPFIFAD